VRAAPLFFVIVQLTLGILTVLTSVDIRAAKWNTFEWMAQLHQFVALLLLLSLVFAAFLVRKKRIMG
jgi:cytochrome c oxidase assembly protein subunit 15